MFHKILIANRGEIAVRIIRACRNMGIRSVAVYSKEDQNSLHVQLADQRVCIGEGPARNNYLNMERIITAARNVGADAIHPGFGFLSENADFVRLCNEYGIAFIGPTAEVINSMGNKSHARQTMMDAKVPVVPGTREPVYDAETGEKFADADVSQNINRKSWRNRSPHYPRLPKHGNPQRRCIFQRRSKQSSCTTCGSACLHWRRSCPQQLPEYGTHYHSSPQCRC